MIFEIIDFRLKRKTSLFGLRTCAMSIGLCPSVCLQFLGISCSLLVYRTYRIRLNVQTLFTIVMRLIIIGLGLNQAIAWSFNLFVDALKLKTLFIRKFRFDPTDSVGSSRFDGACALQFVAFEKKRTF